MAQETDIEDAVRKRGINALPPWSGINHIMRYYRLAEAAPYPDDSRDAMTLLFEGGFRCSESTKIRREMCNYNDEAIVIRRAPVLKKKKPKDRLRDVIIRRDAKDPLANELVKLIDRSEDYLLPGYLPFTHTPVSSRGACRKTIYNRIIEISSELFPHALRSYRASFLVWERGFDLRELVNWFSWESQAGIQMALHYTSQVDMAKKLGITNLPT
jgi:integrase